jgi:hypothetical protein
MWGHLSASHGSWSYPIMPLKDHFLMIRMTVFKTVFLATEAANCDILFSLMIISIERQIEEHSSLLRSFGKRRHDTKQNDTWRNDIQHKDTQKNDTQQNDTQQNDIQHRDTQHNDT